MGMEADLMSWVSVMLCFDGARTALAAVTISLHVWFAVGMYVVHAYARKTNSEKKEVNREGCARRRHTWGRQSLVPAPMLVQFTVCMAGLFTRIYGTKSRVREKTFVD
jgi:hypothetical protein